MNYFSALGLEPSLSIDPADLERRFYSRSRELHPDRFARAPQQEQQRALELSSVLNDAYRTLRNPIARAEYVLQQEGVDSKEVPPDLLEEMFELNMMREEGESIDERLSELLSGVDSSLPPKFAKWDATRDPALLKEIRLDLNRRRYIGNIIHGHV